MADIKGTIMKLVRDVSSSSGEIVKSAKLSIRLANEEECLKALYVEIGKKVHEIYAYGGSLGKFFDEKYKEIDDCDRKIREIKDLIAQAKGTRTCPHCGKTNDKNAEFCSKCGAKMTGMHPPEAPQPADTELGNRQAPDGFVPAPDVPAPAAEEPIIPPTPPPEPAQAYKCCGVCGEKNGPDVRFCMSCGRLLS